MRQYDFGNNQILRPEFLNLLQKILQTYLDIFFLEASGNQVLAPATLDDPISVDIDRRMRRVSVTLAATITGAPGVYDIFFTIYPDGIHLDAVPQGTFPVGSSSPELSGSVPNEYRHVGEAAFDGTVVTSVTTYPTKTGADMLGGRSSSYEAYPNGIPFAGEDGRLHASWLPNIADKVEVVGTIKRLFSPTPGSLVIPDGFVLMAGQTIPAGQHAFPGVLGSITVPNMLNVTGRGASLAAAYAAVASATNSAAGAPGMSGVSGSNAGRDLSHTHPITDHAHDVQSHRHGHGGHQHTLPAHNHEDQVRAPVQINEGASSKTYAARVAQDAPAALVSAPADSQGNIGTVKLGYDPAPRNVTGGGAGTSGSALGSADVRPKHVGLAYLLKVR